MLDFKDTEPKLELFYPLVLHYSANAAILFSYLLYLTEQKYGYDLSNEDLDHNVSFHIEIDDYDLCQTLNMTKGEFFDAALDLLGADLADGPDVRSEFTIWPGHRKKLRSFVYSQRYNWNITQ